MPAGVNWSTYSKMMVASLLSMLAGAQTVHMIYRPLDDMEEYVKEEMERQMKNSSTSQEDA